MGESSLIHSRLQDADNNVLDNDHDVPDDDDDDILEDVDILHGEDIDDPPDEGPAAPVVLVPLHRTRLGLVWGKTRLLSTIQCFIFFKYLQIVLHSVGKHVHKTALLPLVTSCLLSNRRSVLSVTAIF